MVLYSLYHTLIKRVLGFYDSFYVLRKNKDISLDDFKSIWRMEYFHRMWGRTIGAVFYIPAGIMWYKGYFSGSMKKRIVVLGSLLAFQVNNGLNLVFKRQFYCK